MVYRLPANLVKQAVLDVGTRMMPDLKYWAPVNLEFLGNAWEKMCAHDSCRAYGLDMGGATVGLLLGMMMPDLNSGCLQGIEFFWGVEKKFRSRAVGLFRRFEKDCKEAGCLVVVAGAIQSMNPEKMFKLYDRLGYHLHTEEYLKRL
jgi:hypothetical protein